MTLNPDQSHFSHRHIHFISGTMRRKNMKLAQVQHLKWKMSLKLRDYKDEEKEEKGGGGLGGTRNITNNRWKTLVLLLTLY